MNLDTPHSHRGKRGKLRHGGLLLLLKLVVHVVDVDGMDDLPTVLGDVVQIVDASGVGIAVGGVVDCAPAQVDGLVDGEVGTVVCVQDSVGVGGA